MLATREGAIDCLWAVCRLLEVHDVRALMCTRKKIWSLFNKHVYCGPRNIKNVIYNNCHISYSIWLMESLGLKEMVPRQIDVTTQEYTTHEGRGCSGTEVESRMRSAMMLKIWSSLNTVYLCVVDGISKSAIKVYEGGRHLKVMGFANKDISMNGALLKAILFALCEYHLADSDTFTYVPVVGEVSTYIASKQLLEHVINM